MATLSFSVVVEVVVVACCMHARPSQKIFHFLYYVYIYIAFFFSQIMYTMQNRGTNNKLKPEMETNSQQEREREKIWKHNFWWVTARHRAAHIVASLIYIYMHTYAQISSSLFSYCFINCAPSESLTCSCFVSLALTNSLRFLLPPFFFLLRSDYSSQIVIKHVLCVWTEFCVSIIFFSFMKWSYKIYMNSKFWLRQSVIWSWCWQELHLMPSILILCFKHDWLKGYYGSFKLRFSYREANLWTMTSL